MTLIVGIAIPGEGTLLASDSMGSDGHRTAAYAQSKLYALSAEVAFGFTSTWRFGQILGHGALPHFPEGDEFEWLVGEFVPAMRAVLGEHGARKKENEIEAGGTLIIGVRDRVFEIQDDFAVMERRDGFNACGSGLDGALVAMLTARRLVPGMAAQELATLALEMGAEYNAFVRPPWHFIETRRG